MAVMSNDNEDVPFPIPTWDFEFPEHPLPCVSDFRDFLDGPSFSKGNWGDVDGDEGSSVVNAAEEEEEENKRFWDFQHDLLQGIMCRSHSAESRVRNSTKEALRKIEATGDSCPCGRTMSDCRSCLIREVYSHLHGSGYDVGICKSKWRSSSCIPSGEHTFLDVVDNSSSKRGEIRVIVELNFRAEFEIARASEDYNRLLQRLPEVFVGKVERLQGGIKAMCAAAKRCMKEKGMHVGPWRKQRYMQAKWLGSYQRTVPSPVRHPIELPQPPRGPRASMLRMDLLDNMPPLVHCTTVAVV
ncbi:hypothetical protein MLD38_039890 [Melastoma candidum]|uniref:Uncharacterized protein n=1 Tax=Melastoma candidum TaxID=119954 RepID=A0ACB9L3L3_9MYRT|nr:hypothetical protein MLD38_039890 [Melastoma candidum]